MAKPRRVWMPMDVGFASDPKVVEAGWAAAELYYAVLGHLTLSGSLDGQISRQVVQKMGVRDAFRKADRLVKAGLWAELDPDRYEVTAWKGWHTDTDDARRMREYRQRLRDRAP